MNVDQEIAKLVSELGQLIQKDRPPTQCHSLTLLGLQLLVRIFFSDSDLTMQQLAVAVGVSLPSISTKVDKLEKDGLVIRQRSMADRRVVQVRLTPAGQQIMQSHIDTRTRVLRQALADFDNADKKTIIAFFNAYIAVAKKQQLSNK